MRLMARNLQDVWYATYEGDTLVTVEDEYGNQLMTGEHQVSYSTPVKLKASVSPSRGEAQEDMFGTNLTYSRVMVVDDPGCPIDEHSVLWLESEPVMEDGSPVYDHIVVAVARSLNHTSYALSKREVS